MGENSVDTIDLAIAAFWLMHGLEVVKIEPVYGGHPSHCRFYFRDEKGEAESLATRYVNSECRQFDEAIRVLKKYVNLKRKRRPVNAGQ